MTKKRTIRIYGFDDYGLGLKDLANVKEKNVRFHVYFSRRYKKTIFKLKPKKRLLLIENQISLTYEKIKPLLKLKYEEMLRDKKIVGLNLHGSVQDIFKLKNVLLKNNILIDEIWIDGIKGLKKRKKTTELELYTVVGKFAIEMEGIPAKDWDYEERHLMVQAKSFENAEIVFRKKIKGYDEPYMNTDGRKVQWVFKKILDVYWVADNLGDIYADGLETYSVIS